MSMPPSAKTRKAVVTGASGHIGANLVRELVGRGYRVTALVRNSSRALDGIDLEKADGDVMDPASLEQAFRGADHVYHLAALVSMQPRDRQEMQSVNVWGTRNVLNACRAAGVSTLVHFSSIHALQPSAGAREVTEDSPLISHAQRGVGGYEYSKVLSDRMVRENDGAALSTRILYPSAVIGPNDHNVSLLGRTLLKMARGELPVLVDGGYDWVDARDVAWGAVEAAERGTHGDRYILSGQYATVAELAAQVAAATGRPAPRFSCPLWLAKLSAPAVGLWANWRGEEPVYTRESLSALDSVAAVNHARATERLSYRPRPFGRSIRDALFDYSKHHAIPGVKTADE